MGAPGRGCQSTRHQDSSELKRRCSSLLKIPAGVSRSRGCYRWITKDRGVWLCMVAHVCRAHHTKHTTMPPGSVSNWNLVRITEYDWNQQENTSMTNKKFQLNMKHILVLRVLLQQIWSMRLFTLHLFWPISLIKHILHKATLVFEWRRVEGLERFTAIICEMLHSCHLVCTLAGLVKLLLWDRLLLRAAAASVIHTPLCTHMASLSTLLAEPVQYKESHTHT